MTQEDKIVIELPHPIEQLRRLSKALKDIMHPGVSIEKIQQSNMVFKEVRAQGRILRAYNSYLKFRIKAMEQKIRQLQRSKSYA